MDADQIRRLKPMLTRYLKQFDDCFARRDVRSHFTTYVNGQLSTLLKKAASPSPWQPESAAKFAGLLGLLSLE